MFAITVDFMGSGSVTAYSPKLAERPAISVTGAADWSPPSFDADRITVPLIEGATSAVRRLSNSDISELDRAMLASLEFLYYAEE